MVKQVWNFVKLFWSLCQQVPRGNALSVGIGYRVSTGLLCMNRGTGRLVQPHIPCALSGTVPLWYTGRIFYRRRASVRWQDVEEIVQTYRPVNFYYQFYQLVTRRPTWINPMWGGGGFFFKVEKSSDLIGLSWMEPLFPGRVLSFFSPVLWFVHYPLLQVAFWL